MTFRRPSSFAQSPWRTLLALLCIVLVISTATVELTHHHADGEHADCSLCVTAHVAVQAIAGPAFIVLFTRIAAVILAARLLPIEKQTIFALFTRPPPACPAVA